MAKKSRSSKMAKGSRGLGVVKSSDSRRASVPDAVEITSDIDDFYDNREKILLSDAEEDGKWNKAGESGDEEEVFAMDDYELDSEDERQVIAEVPGLRKYLKKRNEDIIVDSDGSGAENALGSDGEDGDGAWGKKKSAFYNDDADYDDEAVEEEAEEASLMRKKQLENMQDEDFMDEFAQMDDSLGSRRTKNNSQLKSVASVENGGKVVRDLDSIMGSVDLVADSSNLKKSKKNASPAEMEAHLINDSPELPGLVSEFSQKLKVVDGGVTALLERVKNGELAVEGEGVSLLDVKNQLMINYMLNLCFYMYLKSDGQNVKDHPVIEKLVKLRLYMEKLKPIESKLKTQTDRLVKAATKARTDPNSKSVGELRYRMDTSAFDVDENEDETSGMKDGIYRPPKIAPVVYDEADPSQSQKNKRDRRDRISHNTSRIIQDAMEEFEDAPEEILDAGNAAYGNNASTASGKEWLDRVRMEEELMTRLPTTRKDKSTMKKASRLTDELADLEDFGDMTFMQNSENTDKNGGNRPQVRINHKQMKEQMEDNSEGEEEMEDDYYMQIKEAHEQQQLKRKRDAEEAQAFAPGHDEDNQMEGDKRAINYSIMKNKGLTPKRSKEQRNPRVKRRMKYESSMVKLKSVRRVVDDKQRKKSYGGEETGIKKNLARSVAFK